MGKSTCVLVLGPACAMSAHPAKPVRFIVPFHPGGGADLVGRVVGRKLGEQWRQQVIVAKRPGAAWNGVVVPARTSRDIVDKLSRDIRNVPQQPDLCERLAAQGVEIVGSTPEELARFIRSEMLKWRQVAGAAGVRVE